MAKDRQVSALDEARDAEAQVITAFNDTVRLLERNGKKLLRSAGGVLLTQVLINQACIQRLILADRKVAREASQPTEPEMRGPREPVGARRMPGRR